jgi:hypothetical protein
LEPAFTNLRPHGLARQTLAGYPAEVCIANHQYGTLVLLDWSHVCPSTLYQTLPAYGFPLQATTWNNPVRPGYCCVDCTLFPQFGFWFNLHGFLADGHSLFQCSDISLLNTHAGTVAMLGYIAVRLTEVPSLTEAVDDVTWALVKMKGQVFLVYCLCKNS